MISIIIPTYNEVENIKVIIPSLLMLFKKEDMDGEIIVVDDNSPDGTGDVARQYCENNPIKIYIRKKDRGLSKSVIKGLELAKGDICVVMDADLSHPLNKIPEMIKPIINNASDLVIGSRYIMGGGWQAYNIVRSLISKIAGFMAKGVTNLSDPTSGFMAFRKSIIDGIELDPLGWKIVLEVAVKASPRIQEIPIMFSERKFGESKLGVNALTEYIRHLWHLYCYKYPVIHELIKFCLVGISGLMIDTLVLMGLVEFIFFDPRLAAIFAFIAAVTWNFIFNRIWTFNKSRSERFIKKYVLFVIICLSGLGIRIGVMHILIKYAGMSDMPFYILASLLGIATATIFNFLGSKYIVFFKNYN